MIRTRLSALAILLTLASSADTAAAPEQTLQPPTCVGDAYVAEPRIAGNTLSLCFVENDIAGCWSFDLAANRWSPQTSRPFSYVAPPEPVSVKGKAVTVCKPDMSDCKSVPLKTTPLQDEPIIASANADRSLVAVTTASMVRVLDTSGRQLATIRPWPTPMSGGRQASFFRSATFVGDTLAVNIADTPVTSAIRLFNPKTGKVIANVNRGRPMNDFVPALDLGKNHYAFIEFDSGRIIVHDVSNGRVTKTYDPGKAVEPGGYSFLGVSPDGTNIWGTSATRLIRINAISGEVASFEPPRCKSVAKPR